MAFPLIILVAIAVFLFNIWGIGLIADKLSSGIIPWLLLIVAIFYLLSKIKK